MKWSVQQLLSFRDRGLHIEESVDVSDLKELDREIREISPVLVTGDGHSSRREVTFVLQISGEMTLPCARTLNDVKFPFSIAATEIFQLDASVSLEEGDEVHELKDNTVDLLPYVKERILLEKPFRVFSDEDADLAPASGKGWELKTEEEEDKEKQVDPRLKGLEKFFDEKK